MFTDSHAHLTCDPIFDDLQGVLERAKAQEVEAIINICTDEVTLKRGLECAQECKRVYNTGATTPHDVETKGGLHFPLFENAARLGKLVAIGETGLDYHYEHSPKALQQTFLVRYFELALQCKLPVVLHCREAFADLFSLAQTDYPKGQAVLHCFTGEMSEAEKAIERGWLISFSGIITFKKSEELRQVVKEVPLNHILIETDSPYLSPQSKRGKPNEPSYISETAQMVANIKGISIQDVARITTKNARDFFQLDS